MTPQEFAIIESVRHARSLSYYDCLRYLHGLLTLIGDCDEAHQLRLALVALNEGDAQLELIASGQLNLPLDGELGRDGHNGKEGK